MTLLEQIQVFIGSIFIAFFFMLIWTIFNALFDGKKMFILRLILEIMLFLSCSYLYHVFISITVNGILNVFYILSIIIAFYIYYKFYFEIVNTYVLNLKLLTELKIKNVIDKMKMLKKEKKEDYERD